jgi:hypothetical protein
MSQPDKIETALEDARLIALAVGAEEHVATIDAALAEYRSLDRWGWAALVLVAVAFFALGLVL